MNGYANQVRHGAFWAFEEARGAPCPNESALSIVDDGVVIHEILELSQREARILLGLTVLALYRHITDCVGSRESQRV
jgi:hypothetical protein